MAEWHGSACGQTRACNLINDGCNDRRYESRGWRLFRRCGTERITDHASVLVSERISFALTMLL